MEPDTRTFALAVSYDAFETSPAEVLTSMREILLVAHAEAVYPELSSIVVELLDTA